MIRTLVMAGVVLLSFGGCSVADRPDADEGGVVPSDLGATLNVRVESDTVRLVLHVMNLTEEALTLEFDTAQRYDFEVARADGAVVWRWSDDMMFAQVEGRESLEPGESRRYEETWIAPKSGETYMATGRLTSRNRPVELRTEFDGTSG